MTPCDVLTLGMDPRGVAVQAATSKQISACDRKRPSRYAQLPPAPLRPPRSYAEAQIGRANCT